MRRPELLSCGWLESEREILYMEESMKCPQCNIEMTPKTRHRINVNFCEACKGMWLEHQELDELEDEVFDFGEHDKGTLIFSSTPTAAKCPECDAILRKFKYRLYDLEMEFCENQHGYWLYEDEDTRVLELMKQEETRLKKNVKAEDKWAAMVRHMHSSLFFGNLRDRLR